MKTDCKLVKVLQAEPMTYGDFMEETCMEDPYEYTNICKSDDAKGYRVTGEGLDKWIPEDEFKENYVSVDTALERLALEIHDEVDKLYKLNKFIDGKVFPTLDADSQMDLKLQSAAMQKFVEILQRRYNRMVDNG